MVACIPHANRVIDHLTGGTINRLSGSTNLCVPRQEDAATVAPGHPREKNE